MRGAKLTGAAVSRFEKMTRSPATGTMSWSVSASRNWSGWLMCSMVLLLLEGARCQSDSCGGDVKPWDTPGATRAELPPGRGLSAELAVSMEAWDELELSVNCLLRPFLVLGLRVAAVSPA